MPPRPLPLVGLWTRSATLAPRWVPLITRSCTTTMHTMVSFLVHVRRCSILPSALLKSREASRPFCVPGPATSSLSSSICGCSSVLVFQPSMYRTHSLDVLLQCQSLQLKRFSPVSCALCKGGGGGRNARMVGNVGDDIHRTSTLTLFWNGFARQGMGKGWERLV